MTHQAMNAVASLGTFAFHFQQGQDATKAGADVLE
jgi:hypothetical protein